jgi:hypothetical protein
MPKTHCSFADLTAKFKYNTEEVELDGRKLRMKQSVK